MVLCRAVEMEWKLVQSTGFWGRQAEAASGGTNAVFTGNGLPHVNQLALYSLDWRQGEGGQRAVLCLPLSPQRLEIWILLKKIINLCSVSNSAALN